MHDKLSYKGLIQAPCLKVSSKSNPQFSRKKPNSTATSDFPHTKKRGKNEITYCSTPRGCANMHGIWVDRG